MNTVQMPPPGLLTYATAGMTLEPPGGTRRAGPGEIPDVLVVHGPTAPVRPARTAVLAVDAPPQVEGGADLACSSAELARDAPDLLRRAWAERRLSRPLADDPEGEWLAALKARLDADEVRLVRRHTPFGPVTIEALSEAAPHRLQVVAPTEAVSAAFGLVQVDGVIASSITDREPTWLLAWVKRDGAAWARRALPVLRAVVDARDRIAMAERLIEARASMKRHDEHIRKLLSVMTHDLRNVFFPIQLALRILERQIGTTKQMATLARSVATGTDLVRRLADATWVFGGSPPRPTPSVSADLSEVRAKVRKRVQERYPEAQPTLMDAIPPIEVPFSEPILEGILHTLVSNAVAHGTEPQVTCTVLADGGAQVVVRNAGQLPFEDVAELQPLEHRARGGLGLGLYVAHHLAVAQGLSLSVRDTGDGHVEAVFTIPSSPPAPDPTMAPESAPVE